MISSCSVMHRPLVSLLESRLAIVIDEHRCVDLHRIVDELLLSRKIASVQDLTERLSSYSTKHALWQYLIRAVTIGETYFFRDRAQIDALRNTVLPALIQERERSGYKVLRLWSAGCSTGEEPYSLAILLRELISDIETWNVKILATDLNISNLERAQQGLYRKWSFRSEMPQECHQRWFKEEVGQYRIDPTIRDMVTFLPLNLAGAAYPTANTQTLNIDVILCRNVLIYFDKDAVNTTVQRFHGALNDNGWLVLGHSESAHTLVESFQPVNFEGAVLYKKSLGKVQDSFQTINTMGEYPVSTPKLVSRQIDNNASAEAVTKPLKMNTVKSQSPDPWLLAYQAANREDWSSALHWLNEAEKTHKFRPEVYYLRGIVDLQQGDMDKALYSLRRATYCKPNFPLAYFTIGEIFEKQGHFKKAVNQWKQAHSFLSQMPPTDLVESSDNLTVEMLMTVLEYRLEIISTKLIRHL